ncbi:MAG: DEAD/DEAH box helicase, partial [Planctomycetota bacterium]|nr:DEAD/DEAH box helicase [Planctomycetota bacterium]
MNDAKKAPRRFTDYQLEPEVLKALERLDLITPTPIQENVIEPILQGVDVVGQAETGTGKTIGFSAPIVGRIDAQRVSVQALVLTPTRELALQVAGVFEELGRERGVGIALIVGGVHASEQVEKLRSGTQVVVGTPGRVLEFLRDRVLSLAWCDTVVLDEADRMLDMGFIEDVSAILDCTPPERQTLVFSATIPPEINTLLGRYMRDPQIFSTVSGIVTVPEIAQKYVECEFPRKFDALRKILDENPKDTAIVFTNTRRQAIDLDRMMWGHGYSAGALHGDQEQDVRFRILDAFRKGEIRVLIATDVASRGLDIPDVSRVINYEVPDGAEAYVHRIGRTGRAKREGEAVTLVASKEWRQWQEICQQEGFEIERVGPARIRRSQPDGRGRGSRPPGRGGRGRRGAGSTGSRESGSRESGSRGTGSRGTGSRG